MVGIMTQPVERTAYDDLVVQARSQAAALGRLYELYYDRIFRFCVHRLFNRALAEDVTSSVFLTVARTMRRFDGRTERDFRAWVYTIAANQANAHIRKAARRRRLLETAAREGPGGQDAAGWSCLDWPTLYEAIRDLKPEHQTILTLRFFEDMGYDEIAAIVRARPGTVRVTLHRVLHRLRQTLQEDLGGDR
jgi:RNA polymerase sigma-70 factor (ECF subfamily)